MSYFVKLSRIVNAERMWHILNHISMILKYEDAKGVWWVLLTWIYVIKLNPQFAYQYLFLQYLKIQFDLSYGAFKISPPSIAIEYCSFSWRRVLNKNRNEMLDKTLQTSCILVRTSRMENKLFTVLARQAQIFQES